MMNMEKSRLGLPFIVECGKILFADKCGCNCKIVNRFQI